jgi:type VI secretion system secreted protein VgrG
MRRQLFFIVASLGLITGLGLTYLASSTATASGQVPSLGTAKSFSVLAGQSVANVGQTVLGSDLGIWPGTTLNGFPPGMVFPPGAKHVANGVAQQAQADATAAYMELVTQPCGTTLTGQDLGDRTLTAGVYCFASSAQLTGALVLDAESDPNALFVFQIGSTLTTAPNSSVSILNGGDGCNPNVYWQVGGSATLGASTTFRGSIVALSNITLNVGATVAGRVLAPNGSITLDTNNVLIPVACAGDTPASSEAP